MIYYIKLKNSKLDFGGILMDNEIKKFLETNRKSHFLQSPEWQK